MIVCLMILLPKNGEYFSDLPPHQEIGMPSLSPTMTEVSTFVNPVRFLIVWLMIYTN